MAMGGGGGGSSSGAIRAGAAFVELFTKDSALVKGLESARRKVAAFASGVVKTGSALAAAGAGLLGPLAVVLKGGIERAGALQDLQDQFGLTADAVSKFGYAADVAGDGVESLERVLKGLAEANTTGKPLDEFALDFADALGEIEDPSERARVALEALGKGGLAFLKFSERLGDLFDEAPLIDQDTLDNAEKFDEAFKKIRLSATAALLPLVNTLAGVADGLSEFVKKNADVLMVVAGVGAGLVAAGAALVAFGAVASGAAAALGLAGAVVTGIGAAVGFLLTPLGLLTAAVVGGTAAFFTLTETGRGLAATIADTLAGAFAFLKDTALLSWEGISAALKSGDLEMAGRIALQGLQSAWSQFNLWLVRQWNAFKAFFVDGWHYMAGEAAKLMAVMGGTVVKQTASAAAQMFRALAQAAARAGLDETAERLRKAAFEARLVGAQGQRVANRGPGLIADNLAKDQAARDAFRRQQEQAAGIKAGFDQIKLAGLVAAAKEGGAKDKLDDVAKQMKEVQLSMSAGTFAGRDAAQLFGAVTSPLTEAAKETAKNTKDILAELKARAEKEFE